LAVLRQVAAFAAQIGLIATRFALTSGHISWVKSKITLARRGVTRVGDRIAAVAGNPPLIAAGVRLVTRNVSWIRRPNRRFGLRIGAVALEVGAILSRSCLIAGDFLPVPHRLFALARTIGLHGRDTDLFLSRFDPFLAEFLSLRAPFASIFTFASAERPGPNNGRPGGGRGVGGKRIEAWKSRAIVPPSKLATENHGNADCGGKRAWHGDRPPVVR
jgi:hypothetical protein